MPNINYNQPPAAPRNNNIEEVVRHLSNLEKYQREVHHRIFGLDSGGAGDLDSDNINGELTDTTDHSEFTNVTEDQHHNRQHSMNSASDHTGILPQANGGTGVASLPANHTDLAQAATQATATASTVSVSSGDADGTYSANEQALINELKSDVNTLVTDLNNAISVLNNVISKLKAANIMAT